MGGTGADLVDRGYGYPQRDFLKDFAAYDNIVTNPPYGIAQQIIEHALTVAMWRVAALVQVKFLASQRRHSLFYLLNQPLLSLLCQPRLLSALR